MFNRLGRPLSVSLLVFALYAQLASPLAAGEVRIGTSATVAEYFEKARENEPALVAFLHKMPKGGDLHIHPLGANDAEDYIQMAIDQGFYFDRDAKTFVREQPDGRSFAPDELARNAPAIIEAISMRNHEIGGESGHDRFFNSFDRFWNLAPNDIAIYRNVFRRAINQRITHLELMSVPGELPAWAGEVEKIRREVLDEFRQKGEEHELSVKIIYPLFRGYDTPDAFKADLVRAMDATAACPALIVGITMLAPEDEWNSQRFFHQQMELLDAALTERLEAHRRDPHNVPPPPRCALHAGELTLEYAVYDSMRDRIAASIRLGHAERIGHGTSIMWEDDVYGLLRHMRDRPVTVEIIPSSSEGILKVSGDRHPFHLYRDAKVPMVIATDDEGVSRSTLTLEYAKAARGFGLSYGEVKWLAFESLERSFLPGESYFIGGDFNFPRRDGDALAAVSEKARLQRRLIDDFAAFERKMEQVIDEFGWDKRPSRRGGSAAPSGTGAKEPMNTLHIQ